MELSSSAHRDQGSSFAILGRNKAFLLLTAAGSSFYKVAHRGYSVESALDVGLCIVVSDKQTPSGEADGRRGMADI
ncbi:hypothetical protein JNB88_33155 [Rhizobium cauense]|nr:hypothetical protein [Rhizobium cauense]